jgi:Flp pilus assembly pilin Flp
MNKKGQSTVEYALIIGCVTIALFGMQVYFKRGIQGIIKSSGDDLSSPVVNFYAHPPAPLTPQTVNPQFQGVEETGMEGAAEIGKPGYAQIAPTTVTNKQDRQTTELGRGQRGLVINNDNTQTTGSWTTRYRVENAADYANALDRKDPTKVNVPSNPVK